MDKNAIKKYAVWARRELIERVAKKAQQYGIEKKTQADPNADSIGGRLLSTSEKKERQALLVQIKDKGYEQVMEEVAYTWFNRFSALRFMEVNGYLPTHVRVFTDEANNFKPQILTEAIHLEMDGLDMDKVLAFKDANQTDELYKYLLITQCNALNAILPGMFQKIADYTELLLPDNLLREGSVIEQMITLIPEDDWKDAVQIIGWLYQYYNSEKKDEVFAALKKNIKITKENIPAATQLFTPDWIVRYMVENSLGRLWLEGHPNDALKSDWKYYLYEAKQEEDVQLQLDKIREGYKNIKPEEIKCIDPCSGSGHILAYMFDVLMKIYEAYGYTSREAVTNIVENNIYGLDIDERAAQLANFAVMMKARQYDRRFFARKDEDGNLAIPQPHVHAISESNHISKECLDYFANGNAKLEKEIHALVDEMHDAKEYGSILNISPFDFDTMFARFDEIEHEVVINIYTMEVMNELFPVVCDTQIMAQKYNIVVTNPPYMGKKSLNNKLSSFLDENYPKGKSELYSAFILKCMNLTKHTGFTAMITIHTWMFISSFENMRNEILNTTTISSMVHTGAATFEELNSFNVLATTFCLRKIIIKNYRSKFVRLTNYYNTQNKLENYNNYLDQYVFKQIDFNTIPGSPFVYWVSENARNNFNICKTLRNYSEPKQGMATADNNRFVRFWFEVALNNICFNAESDEFSTESNCKWFPYNKGGNFRKWYGMNEYVVNWGNGGYELRNFKRAVLRNPSFYFKSGITWSLFGFENFGVRYKDRGFLFDVSGSSMFPTEDMMLYTLAFMTSKVAFMYLSILAPTVNFQVGNIGDLPLIIDKNIKPEIDELAQNCIDLFREDWDDFEESWDFKRYPLIKYSNNNSLSSAFNEWTQYANSRYVKLKVNEERLNQLFIDVYKLQDDLTPNVIDRDIAMRRADLQRDIKGLISYAVGCMFGRYSLDVDGLTYAGGEWDSTKYRAFEADRDNIIPICDDEYFEDDIVGRFVKFIEVVYGKDMLQENLKFIADALGGKGQPKEVIRNYFINDFYNDHCKMYKKRPIYWQFDSGKNSGFKCLIYMHRYQPDTIMRIRTDYVHEQQGRYRTVIADLEQRINGATTFERVKMNNKLTTLQAQAVEIREYEEKIHHLADQRIRIDLDDGVNANYEIFKDVLAKIK